MGLFSTLAVILIVLKALGLVALSWWWCVAPFAVDFVLFFGSIAFGFLFAKRVSKKLDRDFFGDGFEERLNRAKDRLG